TNSNAPASLVSSEVTVTAPGVPPDTTFPITGSLAAGEQRAFGHFICPVANVTSVGCSVTTMFPASTGGNGGGNGGGIIPVSGSLSASPPNIEPGGTVSLTGARIVPPVFDEIRV